IADQRYAEIAHNLRLPASTVEEGVDSLIKAIIKLAKELNIPMSIEKEGVTRQAFEQKVDALAELALVTNVRHQIQNYLLLLSWLRFIVKRIKVLSRIVL